MRRDDRANVRGVPTEARTAWRGVLDDMTDVIETAKSGRSSCRGCGTKIPRGELRFGESLPNPYAEGEAQVWFHLICAACMRPEQLEPVLAAYTDSINEREWLQQAIGRGLAHQRLPRLVRAERAPSGSAHCRQCRELIGKGSWRLALQMFEEGRMQPIGTIHAECAQPYFGTADIMDRVERLTQDLNPADLVEIERQIRTASLVVSSQQAPTAAK